MEKEYVKLTIEKYNSLLESTIKCNYDEKLAKMSTAIDILKIEKERHLSELKLLKTENLSYSSKIKGFEYERLQIKDTLKWVREERIKYRSFKKILYKRLKELKWRDFKAWKFEVLHRGEYDNYFD